MILVRIIESWEKSRAWEALFIVIAIFNQQIMKSNKLY